VSAPPGGRELALLFGGEGAVFILGVCGVFGVVRWSAFNATIECSKYAGSAYDTVTAVAVVSHYQTSTTVEQVSLLCWSSER